MTAGDDAPFPHLTPALQERPASSSLRTDSVPYAGGGCDEPAAGVSARAADSGEEQPCAAAAGGMPTCASEPAGGAPLILFAENITSSRGFLASPSGRVLQRRGEASRNSAFLMSDGLLPC